MAYSKMLSSILTVVIVSLTMSSASASGPTNDSVIPNFFCDLQPGGITYLYNCTMTLLPEKPATLIASKVKEWIKDAPISQFVAEVCKSAPKLFSTSFRVIVSGVEKEFQQITKAVLHTCWNATIYWLPLASTTRYQDIGLYFS